MKLSSELFFLYYKFFNSCEIFNLKIIYIVFKVYQILNKKNIFKYFLNFKINATELYLVLSCFFHAVFQNN